MNKNCCIGPNLDGHHVQQSADSFINHADLLITHQMVVEEAERLAAPGVALFDGPADLCDRGHRRHRRLHVVPHLVQSQVPALLLLSLELKVANSKG